MSQYIPLLNMSKSVGRAFVVAEQRLKATLEHKFRNAGEEAITILFHYHLYDVFADRAIQVEIEDAFRKDVQGAFPDATFMALQEVSRGLRVRVVWHSRTVEAKTGGDFGLLMVQPQIMMHPGTYDVKFGHRGAVIQAKKLHLNGEWGELTDRQAALVQRINLFMILLRYEFTDDEGRHLRDFAWTQCAGKSMGEIEAWLKGGTFP